VTKQLSPQQATYGAMVGDSGNRRKRITKPQEENKRVIGRGWRSFETTSDRNDTPCRLYHSNERKEPTVSSQMLETVCDRRLDVDSN
jgi:hypothetical protein